MTSICKDCFEDREIKGFIISQGKVSSCNFCNSNDKEAILANEILDFFEELFSNIEIDNSKNGIALCSLIQADWSLFRNLDIAKNFLNTVIYELNTPFNNSDILVKYSEDILLNVNHWFVLKEQLKWERRYITDINYLVDELGWDGFFDSKVSIESEDILYRARLHHRNNCKEFPFEEMFCPPKEISTAGRANPMGIPYLYLSDSPETVLYETRSTYLDELSIGEFKLKQDISENVFISDFTEVPTIYHPSEVSKKIKSKLLKRYIMNDLSKPLRRYDSELDYIPTQFICEFIKIYTGVKGIKFSSSLHIMGNNYVIFDQGLFDCTKVEKLNISKVKISSNKV